MARRKFGWHSGKLTANELVIEENLTVNGNLTFGDASTDTLTVTGLSTFQQLMDINARIDLDATSTGTTAIIDIAQTTTGQVFRLDQNNTANPGILFEIDDEATGATSEVVKVASLRTGGIVTLNHESTGAGVLLTATNAGTGKTVFLDANNTGSAGIVLEIDDEATGNTDAVTIASARTGNVVSIFSEGAAVNALEVDTLNGNIGTGIYIDHNETDGAAVGLHIDVASTGATAFAVKVTGIATNSGVFQTNGIGTEANSVTAVFRVQGGSTTYYIPLMSTFA